ncbi:hypothetical protein [Desulfocurvibacter africanus]|uniref:LemA family protein n=1 Tax=Desulfocurvibacter africanus subsp. africanus str. Walvis Bay TaxID=690850 RepID=F3YVY2_DESAF|nr:hypothetical protein [Desulfocurvibacter africanus]EGJ49012.1 hypothetical protein Desaf_0660 [Desulfocurvibacter africanus subsp. africanus str. Walvis Bay]
MIRTLFLLSAFLLTLSFYTSVLAGENVKYQNDVKELIARVNKIAIDCEPKFNEYARQAKLLENGQSSLNDFVKAAGELKSQYVTAVESVLKYQNHRPLPDLLGKYFNGVRREYAESLMFKVVGLDSQIKYVNSKDASYLQSYRHANAEAQAREKAFILWITMSCRDVGLEPPQF